MSASDAPEAPPVVLDRESFTKHTRYSALRVPASKCSKVLKELSGHILKLPKIAPVVKPEAGDSPTRVVMLKYVASEGGETAQPLPAVVQEYVAKEELEVTDHVLTTGYTLLTVDEVLRKILPLPEGVDVPSAFESVGHVAHLNLRDQLLPYKAVIAQVILDKNPKIRTVVNKVGSIETVYRTFELEVLAGDQDLNVEVKEGGATFRFNYAEVYWNSRLQGEHARLVKAIPKNSIVWDMFAGVGPFAVPLALKGCQVYANDLNPRSFHFLKLNKEKNKVGDKLEAFNMCGREFVQQRAKDHKPVHHVVMNLPNSAIDFLDVFPGRFSYQPEPPMLHVYCFSKADDPVADALQRAGEVMGQAVPSDVQVHTVRDVAPRKLMLCLSFRAPAKPSDAGSAAAAGGGGGGGGGKRKGDDEDGGEGGGKEEGQEGEGQPEAKRAKADTEA